MNYLSGLAALVSLSLSSVLIFACLSWMVNQKKAQLTTAWLTGLLVLVFLQSLEFLYHAEDWFIRWPFFLKFVDPLVVLIPFATYGYIRALLGENIAQPRTRLLIHLTPAIVVALLDITYWSLPASERIDWILNARLKESSWEPLAPYGNDYLAIIALMSFIYWHYQKIQSASLTPHNTLHQWVNKLQSLQLIIGLTLISRILLSTLLDINISMVFTLAPIMLWLLYQMLLYTQLPHKKTSTTNALLTDNQNLKPDKSPENKPIDPNSTLLFAELEKAMKQGAFKDNELSLGKIAQHCGLTTHQASAAINQCFGSNFYDWVNHYRIHAAQEALLHSSKSVSDIYLDVGFNSKSTFNTAFRKVTGCTPSEFRKQQQ